MSMFTKQFASADEYENWLRGVGERISVLSITNQPGNRVYRPRQLWIRNPRMPQEISPRQQAGGAITVKYQTTDRSLGPAKIGVPFHIQVALGAAAFFALFMLAIREF